MADTLGQRVLHYLAGPTITSVTSAAQSTATTAQSLSSAIDILQHTTHKAEQTADSLTTLLTLPSGLSGQPYIPRGQFTQRLVSFYHDAFNRPGETKHHVLVVYDRCPRLVSLRGVLAGNGGYVEGPTEMWTVTKKVAKGKGRLGNWGFHVWVFKGDGDMELLGDGGFINWCFKSANCKREGKRVRFFRLNDEEKKKA